MTVSFKRYMTRLITTIVSKQEEIENEKISTTSIPSRFNQW